MVLFRVRSVNRGGKRRYMDGEGTIWSEERTKAPWGRCVIQEKPRNAMVLWCSYEHGVEPDGRLKGKAADYRVRQEANLLKPNLVRLVSAQT